MPAARRDRGTALQREAAGLETDARHLDQARGAIHEVLAAPDLVLTMNNFDGVSVSPAFLRTLEARSAEYKHKVRAKAVLGVTGLKKILINTYSVLTGIDARAFDTEAAAIAYLVSKT